MGELVDWIKVSHSVHIDNTILFVEPHLKCYAWWIANSTYSVACTRLFSMLVVGCPGDKKASSWRRGPCSLNTHTHPQFTPFIVTQE